MFNFFFRLRVTLSRLSVLCASLSFCYAAQAQTVIPAKIPTEFSVSPSGAAVYRVPIQVPPGVAGFEPQLALTYNSQAGNGIMGMGWSLEGLHAITRCPKVLATDATHTAVMHTPEDRFCMDGQRMINVSGSYGAAGSEYRTEIDSFSKIVANGAARGDSANGPQSFTVKTKAGLTLEFGNTEDSRIEAAYKSVVRVWALSKMRDAKGNEINYIYSEDHSVSEFNIARIDYSGDRRISFEYEGRPDIIYEYEANSKTRQILRLTRIKSFLGAQELYSISVAYSEESSGFASLTKEIRRCAAQVCASETGFQWSSAGIPNFLGPIWQGHGGGQTNNVVGDFNGDGLTDMAGYIGGGMWHVCLSNGSGFNCQPWSGHGGGTANNAVGDFNGDGRTDMVGYTGSNGVWHVCLSTGSGFNCQPWVGHWGGSDNNAVGDFNGDGLTDMAGYTGSNSVWHVCLSTGSGFNCQAWSGHGGGPTNNILGDFNGDGRTDMMGYTGQNNIYHVCLSTGGGFNCSVWPGVQGETTPAYGDFNGDGRTDMLRYSFNGGGVWLVCLSTGANFDCELWRGHSGGSGNNVLGDFNGDGRTDMAGYTGSGGVWHVCLSTGNGFNCTYWGGHGGGASNNVVGDFNGDGRADIAGYAGDSQWHVTLSYASGTRFLTRISNGAEFTSIGKDIQTNMNASGGYFGDTGPAYPLRDVRGALAMVRTVDVSNGLGGYNRTTYTYGGLKVEQASALYPGSGRGMLGFRWMKSVEEATGIQTYSEFSQQWPHVGQVTKSETRLVKDGADRVLKLVNNYLGCYQSEGVDAAKPGGATAACSPWAPGKVYFPFVATTVESSWDLNTQMPTLVSTTAYGGYADQSGVTRQFGDPTQITVNVVTESEVLKHRKTIINQYQPARTDGSNWMSGRLKRASVTSTQY